MREQFAEMVRGPGRFEGEPPIVPFIVERDLFDQDGGDVEITSFKQRHLR
jgi:hypothetical protein